MRRRIFAEMALLTGFGAMAGTSPAWAQGTGGNWPSRPIRLVAPYAPGGQTDLVSRLVAERLSSALGQPVVVENRPGSGGSIGSAMVARSAPDGYTFVFGTPGMVINALLRNDTGYDPIRDFTPVAKVNRIPFLIAVNARALPVRTLAELVDAARSRPGRYSYGSAGSGSSPHIGVEWLKRVLQIDVTHVPYRGSGPAITDLVAGNVQMIMDTYNVLQPHIESGALRVIAAAGSRRSALAPSAPTVAESGYPNFDVEAWGGLFGPANLDQRIAQAVADATRPILADPDVRARLESLGLVADFSPPGEFAAYVKADRDRWAEMVTTAGVRID